MDKFKDTDTSHIKPESGLFSGYEFFIVNTDETIMKK